MKIFRKSIALPELLALLAILLLAALLRFAYPGVNSFAGDEAHISLDALRMARGGEFVMAGQPSSVAIPFFPASVWLFAIPYALSPDPLFATLAVSLVSWLTVLGVWWLARRWNSWAGLVAALYMAASPYAVFYGRSIWQPNLLAPLALLWAILAAYAAGTSSSRLASYAAGNPKNRTGQAAIAVTVLVGLLVFQVHFAGIALIPATAYLLLRFGWWRRKHIVSVLIGAGLAALAALPYVYYVTVVAPDVLTRYGQVISSATVDLQGVENLLRLALGWDWAFLGLGDGDTLSRNALAAVIPALLLALGLVAVVKYVTQRTSSPDTPAPTEVQNRGRVMSEITLLLLVISPLTFLRHSSPVLIHYQLIALPAIALLIGAGTLMLANRWWKLGLVGIMLIQAAVWSLQINQTLQSTAVSRPPNSALSSILRESRDAAYEPEQPILFFTHGDDPAIDGEAAVFKALLWTRMYPAGDFRILNGDNLLVLPPYPATLLATLAPFQAWEEIEAAGLAQDVQTYPRRVGADPFVATRYDGVSDPQGFTLIPPIPFEDGTTLIGWRVRRVGPRLRVSTLWKVEGEAPSRPYQQFHHLHVRPATEGAAVSPPQISDVALGRSTWRVGDRVIVIADFFDVPSDVKNLTVDIGHYTLDDMARVERDDDSGSVVQLGPFDAP